MLKGQYIQCRSCGAIPYRATCNIASGEAISASMFEGVNGFQTPVAGEPATCPSCDFPVFPNPKVISKPEFTNAHLPGVRLSEAGDVPSNNSNS